MSENVPFLPRSHNSYHKGRNPLSTSDEAIKELRDHLAECQVEPKDKAHFEVRAWRPDDHSRACSCNPCRTARAVLDRGRGGPFGC